MKQVKLILLVAAIAIFAIFLNGCLTSESKEYRFTVNNDGTGSGSIQFINIISEDEDGADMSANDFEELISGYYEGTAFEDENPNYTVTDKKLSEENGKLIGVVNFTFLSLADIGFYHDPKCDCSEYLFYIGGLSENFVETNGKYLGEDSDFPIISWPADTHEFYFKTIVKDTSTNGHSLLPLYNKWKVKQK